MNQQYYATEDGVLYRKYDYSIIPLEKDRAHKYNNYVRFTTAGGGKVYYRAQHVLVWSYHGNVYNIEERPLLDVMHNNRRMFDFSISNWVPIFTWKEKHDYFIWRLPQIYGKEFRQLLTETKDHVFPFTLISELSVVFSVYQKMYHSIQYTTDAGSPYIQVFSKSRAAGARVKEYHGIHVYIAATFITHSMVPTKDVHHWDWNQRFNNNYASLVWLKPEQQGLVHRGPRTGREQIGNILQYSLTTPHEHATVHYVSLM